MNTNISVSRVSRDAIALPEDCAPVPRLKLQHRFRDTFGSVVVIVVFVGAAATFMACLASGISFCMRQTVESSLPQHRF